MREEKAKDPLGWLSWVIGIDPGLDDLGLCILAWPKGEIVRFSTLSEPDTMKREFLLKRAQEMALRVERDLHGLTTGAMAIHVEDAAYNAKYQSETLQSVRQAIYETMSKRNVVRLVPIQVAKKALTGNGNADKAQMVNMFLQLVKRSPAHLARFNKLNKAQKFAVADAMGIAHAGLAYWKEEHLKASENISELQTKYAESQRKVLKRKGFNRDG
jgi:Holliday junction resolvasome RuvABC endonuclease subunit